MPRVSVVVPTHNRLGLLEKTLESLARQSSSACEFILVDDHSDRRTVEFLASQAERDRRFTLIQKPNSLPAGAQASRNLGLDAVTAETVVFLDSDDLLERRCLEDRHAHASASPSADITVGYQAILGIDHSDRRWVNIPRPEKDEIDRFLRISHPIDVPWVNGGVMFRTASLRTFGVRWRPDFHWDDVAFHFECLAAGMKVEWMRRPAPPDSWYRMHGEERYGGVLSTVEGIENAARMIRWMLDTLESRGLRSEERRRALAFSLFNACILRAVDDRHFDLAQAITNDARDHGILTRSEAKRVKGFITGRRMLASSRRLTYYWNRAAERGFASEFFSGEPSTYGTLKVK